MMVSKKYIHVVFVAVLAALFGSAEAQDMELLPNTSPSLAASSNLLYDATASLNVAAEFQIKKKWTLKVPIAYNPWQYGKEVGSIKQFKFVLVQPELRRWLCEPFTGWFFGVHAHYAKFNVAGYDIGNLKDHRFEGDIYGVGLSAGYDFYLAPRWSLEASLGLGYARAVYDRYNCTTCGYEGSDKDNYIGPTQVGISLIYLIK
ncbi:hypothetical protein AGMMS49965_09330 [Bacteroidia bacterium]|nr:hypothetical protein AGMMS49965_09330 [Bacteroidia bacterium]